MNTHTILVLETGLTGQIENPYLELPGFENIEKYKNFAANDPPRPFSRNEHHEPGTKVRGIEVWQYFDGVLWENERQDVVSKFADYESYAAYYNAHGYKTQIAFEVIEEAAGEGKETEECVVIQFSVPKSKADKLKSDFIKYILENSKSF